MFTINEKTAFFGITDLRTQGRMMLKSLKGTRVVITERNKPKAVVIGYSDYERMQELIEMAEEGIDSFEIEKRRKKPAKFLTHAQVVKALPL